MPRSTTTRSGTEVAHAVEQLRLAEAQLSRRRQSRCGPGDTERVALQFILDRNDRGEPATPTALAKHLAITTASTTGVLDRLVANGLIARLPSPTDRRSSVLVPGDRRIDVDGMDPLSAPIAALASALPESDAATVRMFLEQVTRMVTRHCR